MNGKHTDTGIEPGTLLSDLTAPAPLHQWCVPVKKRSTRDATCADARHMPFVIVGVGRSRSRSDHCGPQIRRSRRAGRTFSLRVTGIPGAPGNRTIGQDIVALPISLVHSFVELNGKHTDTGIEPGTPIFDLTAPAPLHQWCVPVKRGVRGTLPMLTPLLPSTVAPRQCRDSGVAGRSRMI